MVTIAEFGTYMEAVVARSSLEANGVKCFLPNENVIRLRGGVLAGISLMQTGIYLQVAEEDAETARAFLADKQP